MTFVAKGVEEPTTERAYVYHEVAAEASGFDADFAVAAEVEDEHDEDGETFEETEEGRITEPLDDEPEAVDSGPSEEEPYEENDGLGGVDFFD